jgi:hypothetical protein
MVHLTIPFLAEGAPVGGTLVPLNCCDGCLKRQVPAHVEPWLTLRRFRVAVGGNRKDTRAKSNQKAPGMGRGKAQS